MLVVFGTMIVLVFIILFACFLHVMDKAVEQSKEYSRYEDIIDEAQEELRKIQEELYGKQEAARRTYQRTYRSHWSAPRPPVTVRDVSLDLAILGLSATATTEEIKSAYRTLCSKYHPDVNPSGARKFIEINQAYARLMGK